MEPILRAIATLLLTAVIIALVFVIALPGMIFRAFVFTKIWGWFVVPYGLPSVGVVSAMGIFALSALFTQGIAREPTKDSDDKGPWVKAFGALTTGIFATALTWLIAWIIHLYL